MKILFIIDTLNAGGKQRQLSELINGLSNHKDIIYSLLLISRNIHYKHINHLNIKIHYLIRNFKKDPKILIRLYQICKEERPDIIHTWDSMASVYALPVAKILRIKFINGMIRNAPLKLKPFGKAWIRSKITFPFSDVIISNSHAGLKSYRVPLKKGVCIHNGYRFERINKIADPEFIKKKFSIKTEKVIGMVASFSKKKDYKAYILAAQLLLKKRNDVTFLTVGNGVNLMNCKDLVKTEFKKKIRFLGLQNDVESIINLFNIGVLSTYSEGISNSIMEYMALGKPVITTDCRGTRELVLDGKTGFLIRPRDIDQLYKQMDRLLENEDIAIKMGAAGKNRIFKEFSIEIMVNSYVSLYENIVHCSFRYP